MHTNGIDLTRTFTAHLCAGGRGFSKDVAALETYCNEVSPCVKTMQGFILVVEI